MARSNKSLFKLSGTLYDATFVYSKTYGHHIRAPRGTYKRAAVNETLNRNAKKADIVNATAKVVNDFIKSVNNSFKDGTLWSRMLKCMFQTPSTHLSDLLASIKGIDISKSHALERLIMLPNLSITTSKRKLRLDITCQFHPFFSPAIGADCYYYTFHLLYINAKGQAVDTDGIETEWVQLTDEEPQYSLSFDIPAKALYYVLLLEVDAGYKQVPLGVLPGKGIRIMEVGSVSG